MLTVRGKKLCRQATGVHSYQMTLVCCYHQMHRSVPFLEHVASVQVCWPLELLGNLRCLAKQLIRKTHLPDSRPVSVKAAALFMPAAVPQQPSASP